MNSLDKNEKPKNFHTEFHEFVFYFISIMFTVLLTSALFTIVIAETNCFSIKNWPVYTSHSKRLAGTSRVIERKIKKTTFGYTFIFDRIPVSRRSKYFHVFILAIYISEHFYLPPRGRRV